jgi:hypothetical protein
MSRRRTLWTALAAAAVLGGSLLTRPAYSQDISDSALQQIKELLDEKDGRTPAQQKLGSQLVYAIKTATGQPITPSIPSFPESGLTVSSAEGVLVDISGSVSTDLLAAISRAGGRVIYASAPFGSVRARVPVLGIEGLAARSDVDRIKPGSLRKVQRQQPAAISRRRQGNPGPAMWRGELIPFQLARLLGTAFFIGATTTQGVVTHAANTARSTFGASGAGIKVGVLSDSAEQIPLLIATGDLPPDVVLVREITDGPGTSEGTAMMEIIYDMAPGVKLFFATAFDSPASFAQNILDLRNIYGCDIIVDDVGWSDEGVFQDTIIARAVNSVTASGALYFSSAANSGNLTSGTATTWEGDFVSGGTSTLLPGYTLNNFSGGQLFNRLLTTAGVLDLQWSDPQGGSRNDYDLFVLNSAGTAVLAASTGNQNGTQDPIEEISSSGIPANARVVIAAVTGAQPRGLHLDAFFGDGQFQFTTSGATVGHNAGRNTVGVAAVAWNSARGITRPFPGGALNPTETFSSDGPRRIFFNPDGTPITGGNFLFGTNGGLLLMKPDIAAADGVSARTPGFSPFFGTSAAAPHAAAIAALVKSAKLSLTAVQIYNAMISTALDIRGPGIDRDSGYGLVMADKAVARGLQ